MAGRLIAIGDVHGYAAALMALLEAIAPDADDTLVTLGDYVDRGPDTPRVLETLIALGDRCRLVPVLGNHDEMLLDIRDGLPGFDEWLAYGGRETLAAYDCTHPEELPKSHLAFLETKCVPYYETSHYFFLHANYVADLPLDRQDRYHLRWESLRHRQPGPHISGKVAIVGHTAQRNGQILDLGYLRCIDTCCYCGLWLTALEVPSGRVWQADPTGRLRAPSELAGLPPVGM